MRYIVSGEFTKIDETSGTIQNTSKINVVEVSDTNEKGSGIMLYPLDRFTFSKSLYARCVDGGGAEVRVVPFEVDAQGGGVSSTVVTVPGGGGSGIAFAGMILDTVSSTVDGGLWYEVTDGLPVVKMNHEGGEFLIDTRPAEDALIGDKLFLDGHIFKFTGFADGLTFSGNNFYAADTVVGSVSNYAFQFTDAVALSVADGGTISITQLDTDTVVYSLDLESLNTAGLPWDFSASTLDITQFEDLATNSKYVYKSGQSKGYIRTGDAAYTKASSENKPTLTLNLATGLKTDKMSVRTWNASPTKCFPAGKFLYVTVEEIYNDSGTLTEFKVTINQNAAIQNSGTWLDTITATASDSSVKVTIQFNGTDLGYGEETEGSLTRNEKTGVYTFKTDTYIDGYFPDSNDADNVATLTRMTGLPTPLIQGDICTIDGLAEGLNVKRTDAYKYNIYKNGDENAVVGTIVNDTITITNAAAFKNATTEGVIATVIDTEGDKTGKNNAMTYSIAVSDALKTGTGSVTEGFTYNSTTKTYTYQSGKVAAHYVANDPTGTEVAYQATSTVSYVPEEIKAKLGNTYGVFSMSILGMPNLGELVIDGSTIKTTDDTVVGTIDIYREYIDVGTNGGYNGNYYTLAAAGYPTITLSGNNEYILQGTPIYKTLVSNYSDSNMLDLSVDTYYIGYSVSDNGKTATYHGEGISYKRIYLTPPSGYIDVRHDTTYGRNCTAVYWRPEGNGDEDDSGDILFFEFNGQDWVLNSHAFDGVTTADTINITNAIRSTPLNFNIKLATDADTAAISRTFANETFTAGVTAGTYTYTATGTTAGWNVSADGTKISSWELNGKTFTIENLRTDLGTIGFDSQGYIHATNGSTIGRMGGNVIKLYDTAVHKLATPILTGADAADFTLILPT